MITYKFYLKSRASLTLYEMATNYYWLISESWTFKFEEP